MKDDIRKQEPVIRNLLAERLLRGGIVDKDLSRYGIHLAGRVSFVIAYQIEEQPSEEMEVGTGEAIVYKQVLLRKLEDILCGEQYACDMDIKGGAVICVLREGKDYQKEKLDLWKSCVSNFGKKMGSKSGWQWGIPARMWKRSADPMTRFTKCCNMDLFLIKMCFFMRTIWRARTIIIFR